MCRSGCPTQDHLSYAACCKGLQLNAQGLSGTAVQKRTNAELDAYAAARAEGIQPMGTKMHQVEQARRVSDATGVAFGV